MSDSGSYDDSPVNTDYALVVGVLLWLINRFIPMVGSIKSILNAVVVIAVVLWLLNVFGIFSYLSTIHVGQ